MHQYRVSSFAVLAGLLLLVGCRPVILNVPKSSPPDPPVPQSPHVYVKNRTVIKWRGSEQFYVTVGTQEHPINPCAPSSNQYFSNDYEAIQISSDVWEATCKVTHPARGTHYFYGLTKGPVQPPKKKRKNKEQEFDERTTSCGGCDMESQ